MLLSLYIVVNCDNHFMILVCICLIHDIFFSVLASKQIINTKAIFSNLSLNNKNHATRKLTIAIFASVT